MKPYVLVAALVLAAAPGLAGGDVERELAEALARHHALLEEAAPLVRGGSRSPEWVAATEGLAAFETSLGERELLDPSRGSAAAETAAVKASPDAAPDASAPLDPLAFGAAPAPVSSAPSLGRAAARREPAATSASRLGWMVAEGAPDPTVAREVDRLASTADGDAHRVRELVQEMIFAAVARTAVELRRALEAARRNEAVRATLRRELARLRTAIAEASGELRTSLAREAGDLEGRIRTADDDARRAEVGLRERLGEQEPLLERLARVAVALQDRAAKAVRESRGG